MMSCSSFCFFKQKTGYEMRISDWSSDVCSSDLIKELTRLGADEIVPEELETSVEIFARVLRRYGVPNGRIRRMIEEARADQYEIFREIGRASWRERVCQYG